MAERIYACRHCRNVFRPAGPDGSSPGREIICPKCGSSRIGEVPSWAPAGFDLYQGPPVWKYECQHCHHVFKLPVPSDPSPEKAIKCPECGGAHIHNVTIRAVCQPLCGA